MSIQRERRCGGLFRPGRGHWLIATTLQNQTANDQAKYGATMTPTEVWCGVTPFGTLPAPNTSQKPKASVSASNHVVHWCSDVLLGYFSKGATADPRNADLD